MITLKLSNRQLKTICSLTAITAICWPLVNYSMYLIILPPLLFATALICSNLEYLKYRMSPLIIFGLFLFIYLYGTLPFYQSGPETGPNYFSLLTGCLGTFFLVILTMKLVFRRININTLQILITTAAAIACATVIQFSDQNFNLYTYARVNPGIIIAIYQGFLSLSIFSIIRPESVKELDYKSGYR